MPKILPYSAISVSIINQTDNPASSVAIAAGITMHREPDYLVKPATSNFCKNLAQAGHYSIFEHVQMTFLCENISRSLLAQVTRQRTAHPTSGSQHYQEYSDYPMMISPDLFNKQTIEDYKISSAFDICIDSYKTQIKAGVPKEEARQVLPNACGVNYLWTIDAANLFKFLQTRLCNRNVLEMRIFAEKIHLEAISYFPELFEHAFPSCLFGHCKEKALNMQCDELIYKSLDMDSLRFVGDPIDTASLCLSTAKKHHEKLPNSSDVTIGLAGMISQVKQLQRSMGYVSEHMTLEERMKVLVENAFALNMEVSELVSELPWKSWRDRSAQKYAKQDRIADEFADCLIFLFNVSFYAGLSTAEIIHAFTRVMVSNYDRVSSGKVILHK